MSTLKDCKVLTLDCYGTLIDWETGVWDALQPLLMANGRADVMRGPALVAFAEAESAQQSATPDLRYDRLLAAVHGTLAGRFGLDTTAELDAAFGASVPHWPAFPDSADALRRMHRHVKLVILSNVHRDGFAASNRKLGVTFNAVYTAEDIGSYKPDARNFDYLLGHIGSDLGLGRGDILHTAQSLFHDHRPAREAGLANCWIDRQRLSEGGSWGATRALEDRPQVDYLYFTLMQMAEALEAARR